MTSSNGNIFRVADSLCGNSPATGEFPTQRPVMWSFHVFFDLHRINGWVNGREAGDLKRRRPYYDVIVMMYINLPYHLCVLCSYMITKELQQHRQHRQFVDSSGSFDILYLPIMFFFGCNLFQFHSDKIHWVFVCDSYVNIMINVSR